MEQINLDVQLRNRKGSSGVRKVLREDLIPGIVYGGGDKPTVVQADRKTYERIHRQHIGESLIYHLNIVDNGKKIADFPAIVKDVQMHPVSDRVVHLDFNRISLDKEIEIKVQITLKGEAIGIKRDGATIDHMMRELDIICLPTNIPHHIEVDVTNLGIHDSVHVRDLALPKGVRTKHEGDSVVVACVGSTQEAAAEVAEAPAELEVLKEKKKDETAEAAKKEEKK